MDELGYLFIMTSKAGKYLNWGRLKQVSL